MKTSTKESLLQTLKYWRRTIERSAGDWILYDHDWRAIQNAPDAKRFTKKYLQIEYKIFIRYI